MNKSLWALKYSDEEGNPHVLSQFGLTEDDEPALKMGETEIKESQIVKLDPPTENGTYVLQATVVDGVVTFAWVTQS